MDVYVYQADLYCRECGEAIRADLERPADPDNESDFDSDHYPKGPYGDGGGESDTPSHCGGCRVFLDNPLTGDGESYVREKVREFDAGHGGAADVIEQWRERYSYCLGESD